MAKTCLKCGNTLEDDAKFCPKCGTPYGVAPACIKCGHPLTANDRFCPNCGTDQTAGQGPAGPKASLAEVGETYIKKGFDNFASTINSMAGETGKVEIRVKDLFSDVLKKHTQAEKDELFICGTSKTTPKESEMIAEWPHPWLFARVFLMFAVVFAGLYFMAMNLRNSNTFPGAMFVGAMLVPISVIIFFWETNIPRNISIVDVISVFFAGGVLSLVITLLLFEIFPAGQLDYTGAAVVGIVEEAGKVLATAYYIKKRNCKYKLNGLLLGSCVGGGFAVFETAGYAFNVLTSTNSLDAMMNNLFLRGVLAIGGHVTWAAITGFALIVAKGDEPLDTKHILSATFLKFFVLVAALHAIWDCPLATTSARASYTKLACLIAIAVATALVLLASGLKQVSAIAKKAQEAERAGHAEPVVVQSDGSNL